MKTSLNKLQLIEDYLLKRATPAQQLLWEARLLLDPALRDDTYWQQRAYRIVREYGRQQQRRKLEEVHTALFKDVRYRGFREKVLGLFKKED